MRRKSGFLMLVLLLFMLAHPLFAQEIALSFDDAPRRGTSYFSGPERAKALLAQLKSAQVREVVFSCIAQNIDDEGRQRLFVALLLNL